MPPETSTPEPNRAGAAPASRSLARALALLAAAVAGWWLTRPSAPENPAPAPERELLLSLTTRTNGRIYAAGSSNPFTGQVVEYYRNGRLKSRSGVSNGWLEGLSLGWFTNGAPQIEEPFHAGRSHGTRTKWDADGNKVSEARIVNGELHGVFRRWHPNGKLSQEVPMRHGKAHGLSRAWHPSGYLKARVRLTNGVVVEQEFFEDGKRSEDP